MHKASLLFIFEPNPGFEGSMSTLRSGPRRPRSPGPRAPSRAFKALDFQVFFYFMLYFILHRVIFLLYILSVNGKSVK